MFPRDGTIFKSQGKASVIEIKTTYQVLHHPLPLCPELPDHGEHIAPPLPLNLLHQHRQPNKETASVRAIPEKMHLVSGALQTMYPCFASKLVSLST